MRRSLALAVVPVVSASVALSAPGITTSNVNFRAGPGTEFESFAVLPSGTALEILECSVSSVWCEVLVDGEAGFVSGNFVSELVLPVAAPPGEAITGPVAGPVLDGEALFTDDELDTLVAPIALVPDDLLAQILVAATVPLEVVRADRWVAANAGLAPEERAAAAEAEGWDESVAILAAGFPSVVTEMARDLEWTEWLGEAVIAQSEDVLDAVQRQRARARALGNLESNEAQRVEVTNNVIVIEPAQPDVVFVPRYDPVRVFTEPAPAPVVVQQGVDAGTVIATGAVAFVTGYTIGRVFDDRWRRSYWWGPPRVNWTVNNFYPRPGWRPGERPDRPWRPGERPERPWRPGERPERPGRPGERPPWAGERPERPGLGRPERPGRPEIGRPERPGRPEIGRPGRPGSRPEGEAERPWRPDDRRREEARQRIRDQRASGERPGATRPGAPGVTRPGAPGARPGDRRPDRAAIEERIRARSPDGRAPTRPRPGIERPGAERPSAGAERPQRPPQTRPGTSRPGGGETATDRSQRARDARRAAERGRQSTSQARPPQQRVSRPAERSASRPQRQAPPQRAVPNRPQQRQAQRPPQRQAQQRPNRSAIERGSGGARQAAASRSRGAASRGGERRDRRQGP